jgi:hypothetical protein
MMTLDSASMVVLLALNRDVPLPAIELLMPAAGFSVSLLLSLHGMVVTQLELLQGCLKGYQAGIRSP